MELKTTGIAGTLESGDIMIEIRKSEKPGISVELTSTVGNQFGKQIEKAIITAAKECGLDGVEIVANDKGSLDCTIRARVTTAAMRGSGKTEYEWA